MAKLREAFHTSHSRTFERENVFCSIVPLVASNEDPSQTQQSAPVGWGEAGLPPLKPGCYLADVGSCSAFFDRFKGLATGATAAGADDSALPVVLWNHRLPAVVSFVLTILDGLKPIDPSHRAMFSAMECAALELWAQLTGHCLHTLLPRPNVVAVAPQKTHRFCFCTVGVQEGGIETSAQAVASSLKLSPFVKLKVNNDIATITAMLQGMMKAIAEHQRNHQHQLQLPSKRVVLDANAAWSVETSAAVRALLSTTATPADEQSGESQPDESLGRVASLLYAVEQPFPVAVASMDGAERAAWEQERQLWQSQLGVDFMADESAGTLDDLTRLRGLCGSVNVKLEKCGGLRAAVSICQAAVGAFDIWIGIMVGSTLNSNAAARLLPWAHLGGDLDGQFLIDASSNPFVGGFSVDNETGIVKFPDSIINDVHLNKL